MGIDYNSIIVTDGLVGYWDAANIRSYSGSGNTWYDLTRNGNNLTLTNSPTFNASGYFTTNSTGYFTGVGSSSIPSGSNSYTMSCIAQLPTWANYRGIMSIGGYGSNNGSNAIRTGDTADPGYFYNYWWFNDLYVTNNNGNTASSRWFNISATYDGTTRKIYVNSILVGSDTPTAPNVSSTTIQLAKTWNTEYLNGLISLAKIYNRALTATEILQNYNATKRRYGL
jgi:hypothetical protein